MAYDRARRFPKLITQTPPKIGPGTYEVSELPGLKRHLADIYPFLCGAKRKTIAVARDAKHLPGPATYTIKKPQQHIPGGVSIDFTESRFKKHVSVGPGPVFDVAKNLLKPTKVRLHPGTWKGAAGKLWLTGPPRSIIPNATSIPGKHYTGYSVNEYGAFVKNPPIRHEPTYFYDVPREESNTTTLIYKGNFWSRMTGRKEPRVIVTPGPGDYEHERKKTAIEIQTEKIKEEKRLTCAQSRFLDTMYKKIMRENFPAPNCYKVKGTFDRFMDSECKCDPYALEPPPFGLTAKRFEDKTDSGVPAPGTYDPPVKIKCVGSIYPAPFGVCASRLKKGPDDTGPGPGDYNLIVGNLAYESQKKFKYSYVSQMQPQFPFASISRYIDAEDYDDDENATKQNEEKKSHVFHAAFKSTKPRFPTFDKDVPDPGAYEVLASYKANRDKCNFLCSRLAPAFGTRSSRIPKYMFGYISDAADPACYELAGDISRNVRGGVISRSKIRREMSVAPPPTHYCIHPYLASSVIKKSHNVSLGKSELIKEVEKRKKSPSKRICPCKKKTLRWFAIPKHKHKRCRPVSF